MWHAIKLLQYFKLFVVNTEIFYFLHPKETEQGKDRQKLTSSSSLHTGWGSVSISSCIVLLLREVTGMKLRSHLLLVASSDRVSHSTPHVTLLSLAVASLVH